MTLLERVAIHLSDKGVAHALIGAAALAVHGVSRSTVDQDLLVVDLHVLDRGTWTPFEAEVTVDITRGDPDDPLAGVVRCRRPGERDVDVVIGRHPWQEAVLRRAVALGDGMLRVVEPADLILLKLYAGGSQDRWDIEQLLALDGSRAIARSVDDRLAALPPRLREVWAGLRPRP